MHSATFSYMHLQLAGFDTEVPTAKAQADHPIAAKASCRRCRLSSR